MGAATQCVDGQTKIFPLTPRTQLAVSLPHHFAQMGCCQSVEDQDGKLRNDEIENQLKRDRANMRNEIKMLLLGKFPI